MNCPACKTPIPEKDILNAAAKINGAKGGKASGPRKARSSEQARAAAYASHEARRLKKTEAARANAKLPRKKGK